MKIWRKSTINEDNFTQVIKDKIADLVKARGNERRQVTRIMNSYSTASAGLEGDDLEEYLNSMSIRLTARNRAIEALNAKDNKRFTT